VFVSEDVEPPVLTPPLRRDQVRKIIKRNKICVARKRIKEK
jgi:hypothetical protein